MISMLSAFMRMIFSVHEEKDRVGNAQATQETHIRSTYIFNLGFKVSQKD
jgi:energy-coupling factor transporter transmembrane protein EcfT